MKYALESVLNRVVFCDGEFSSCNIKSANRWRQWLLGALPAPAGRPVQSEPRRFLLCKFWSCAGGGLCIDTSTGLTRCVVSLITTIWQMELSNVPGHFTQRQLGMATWKYWWRIAKTPSQTLPWVYINAERDIKHNPLIVEVIHAYISCRPRLRAQLDTLNTIDNALPRIGKHG